MPYRQQWSWYQAAIHVAGYYLLSADLDAQKVKVWTIPERLRL